MKKLKGFLLFFVCCLLSCVTAVSLTACNGEKNSVTDGQTVGSFNENQAAADTGSTSGTVSYLYSIQLDAKGAKNQFKIGEEFSGDGIKMSAVIYDVGTSVNTRNVDVTKDVVIDASAFNNKKPGSYKIYVSYTYEGTTLYSNYTVNVVSAIEGTIAGLVMEYNGARQAELSSAATKASLDISGLKVSLITGKDANNTAIKLLERSEYSLSYSKDGGELVPVAENVTSITDLTRGTYSFFATSEYKSGAESFTMTSFFTFYVLDPVESFTKDEGGTVEFEYDTDKVIGEDWKYTVRYASGAEEKLDYSDVEMGEAVNDEEGAQSVTVTYSEEQLGFDSALNDAVSKKYSKTCEVAYEIGENPNAGAEVTDTYGLNFSAAAWNEEPYTTDGGMPFNQPVAVGADGNPATNGGIIAMYGKDKSSNFYVRATDNSAANAAGYTSEFYMGAIEISSGIARRAIQIDLSDYDSATVTVVWRANSGRGISLYTDESVANASSSADLRTDSYMASENSTDDAALNTAVFDNVAGGDVYYLGGNNNTVYLYEITITAKKEATVTAVSESWKASDDNLAHATAVAVGDAIVDTDALTITSTVEVNYSSSLAKDPPSIGGEVVTAGYRQKDNTAVNSTSGSYIFTAKCDMELTIYVTVCNDSYNSHRDGCTITYTVGSKENTVTSGKRNVMSEITVELKAGESLSVNVTMGEKDGKLWLFGYSLTGTMA